jgi:hypothetical protein
VLPVAKLDNPEFHSQTPENSGKNPERFLRVSFDCLKSIFLNQIINNVILFLDEIYLNQTIENHKSLGMVKVNLNEFLVHLQSISLTYDFIYHYIKVSLSRKQSTCVLLQGIENKKQINSCKLGEEVGLTDKSIPHR